MSNVSVNKEAIKKNKKRIFEIDSEVMTNKTMIYASRSMIEENRLMILSNYAAAFMGNRQIANSNTDEIFENRQAILDNAETNNEVEENFINSQKNKAALDFLNHRSALNSAVLSISEEMADINSRLIDINRRIMESNQEIVEFNQNQIEMNSSLLGGDLQPSNATPESNATTIENNQKMMAELEKRVSLIGPVNDVASWLEIMDVFLLTSFSEGLPNVVIEAQGFGIPVVSTDAGGVSEIVNSGVSGLIVESGSPEEIANSLTSVLDNIGEESREKISEAIRDKFSIERMILNTEKEYRSHLSGKGRIGVQI